MILLKNLAKKYKYIIQIFFWIIFICIVIFVASIFFNSSSETKKFVGHEILTYAEIMEEYDNNEIAADERYVDKFFYVEGIVKKVRNGLLGDIVVECKPTDYSVLDELKFCFDKTAAEKIKKLNKGDKILIYGRFDMLLFYKPVFENCRLIKVY